MTLALPAKFAAAKAQTAFNLVGFTIGAEAANTINAALQLKDARGRAIAQVAHLEVYLSDLATGADITGTATTSALAVGTNGKLLLINVTGKMAKFVTDASGRLDINIIQTAALTYYLAVKMPDGSIQISSAITFV